MGRRLQRELGQARERGMVLVTTLLLLIVVTLIALAMFRSFGLDEKMAGNVRDKQRALNTAETAEEYAEYWLLYNGTSITPASCSAVVAASTGQICTNALASPATLPWTASVTYTPPTSATPITITGTTPEAGGYFAAPAYYITLLGTTSAGAKTTYQIDAVGYGTSPDSVAVVETTYVLKQGVTDLTTPE
jgi:type IV pilus assembly protein PilX